jgi:hypothetical protein
MLNPAEAAHQPHQPDVRLHTVKADVHHHMECRDVADQFGEAFVHSPQSFVAGFVVIVAQESRERLNAGLQ